MKSVLNNPRCAGRRLWNQRRDEFLLDVEDVSADHETKIRRLPERSKTK
jgi:hypothetical protein